jgi:hypothetical protein
MKRVQVVLEEWQHNWLIEEAERQLLSVSAFLRQLITQAIDQRQTATATQDPLWEIVGIGAGPEDGVNSENLDLFLYPLPQPTQLLRVAEARIESD